MIQRGECFRFALEPQDPVTVLGECGRQNLQRDVAIERGITGAIHLAHAAGPQRG
jgi:hypothetical protein